MKNILIGVLLGIILGGAGGFAAGIFVFPYLFPPPPVNEVVPEAHSKRVVARGEFIHANPSDPVHYGKGKLTLYEDLVHLEADFEVGPGPKFHVYLVPEDNVSTETRVQDTMYVDLGRLKAFAGSQNYVVPEGVNLEDYKFVVIWCERFNVLISPARLAFGS
ncbi:MAG: DM13 domain-containing protein [Gammaproteobacteria bacterium]|nr:DM13 domain-containing protein [Gammaproteobacteria bacterium]